jgi:hypothetical protein
VGFGAACEAKAGSGQLKDELGFLGPQWRYNRKTCVRRLGLAGENDGQQDLRKPNYATRQLSVPVSQMKIRQGCVDGLPVLDVTRVGVVQHQNFGHNARFPLPCPPARSRVELN